MLHNIGRFILRIGAEFFFGKHHIKNLERLNNGRPMVVCSNHTAAHLDAVLIMIFSKREFHVLVRADVFNRKWIASLLAKINLIPIYRMRDGFSNLEKNNATFERCNEILKNNGAIIIFPEANCETERKLRKLNKGAAKIAMMAEEQNDFKLGVQMATVGITQEHFIASGGRIFLEASEPFDVKPYIPSYQINPNKALMDILNDVETDLRSVLPVVERTEDEFLFEQIVKRKDNIDNLEVWKNTATLVNKSDADLKSALSSAIKDFNKYLKKSGINQHTIEELQVKSRLKRWANLLVYLMDMIAMFPFFLIGFVFNYFQYFIPKKVSHSIFKDDCFINGTHFAITTFLFITTYVIFAIVLSMYVNLISVVIAIFVMIICGFVSYYYRKRAFNFLRALRYEMAGQQKRKEWRAQSRIISSEIAEWVRN